MKFRNFRNFDIKNFIRRSVFTQYSFIIYKTASNKEPKVQHKIEYYPYPERSWVSAEGEKLPVPLPGQRKKIIENMMGTLSWMGGKWKTMRTAIDKVNQGMHA